MEDGVMARCCTSQAEPLHTQLISCAGGGERSNLQTSTRQRINATLAASARSIASVQSHATSPLITLLQGDVVERKRPIADWINGDDEIEDGVFSIDGRFPRRYAS